MTVSIVRRRTPPLDQWGEPTGTPVDLVIGGFMIAPRTAGAGASSSSVDGRNREGVLEGFTLQHRDPYLDIRHTDQVILPPPYGTPDDVFDVDGEVGPWINHLSGREHGCEFAVRRAAG